MNNQKCPNCGFINFATAEACRKCETLFISADHHELSHYEQPAPSYSSTNYHEQPTPDYSSGSYQQSGPSYSSSNYYQLGPPKRKVPVFKICALSFLMLMVLGGVRIFSWYRSQFTWQDFKPNTSSLTIMMPGEPSTAGPIEADTEAGKLTTYSYTYMVPEQGSLIIGLIKGIPVGMPGSRPNPKVLHATLDSLMSETNSTLISQRDTYDHSFPAVEFEMQPPGNSGARKNRGFGKLIFTTSGLYILTVVAYEDTQLFSERSRFLNPPERYGNAY
jgi:hypothetical protein